MKYSKHIISIILILIVNSIFSQNNEKTLGTNYYTITNGNYSSNIWSTSCHTCVTCSCAPACNVPPNTTIYIKHNVTSTCTTLDVGANSTFILLPGGSFSLLGNGSITGSGSLTVSSGSSLTVTGNLSLSGGGDATINGVVNVTGTLSISGTSDICGTGSIKAGTVSGSAACAGVPFGGTLPVELIEFTGTCVANGVQLNWSTASETNNAYFLVEKSSNAVEWQTVAKVAGNGTSGSVNKYFHLDYDVNTNELIYYRLSQVDENQSSEVFKAIEVNCGNDTPDQMFLFSNPASTELNIFFNVNNSAPNSSIHLMNNMGQIVMETKLDLMKGLNTFVLPIDINPGTYNIMFSSEKIVLPSQKLLIVK